MGRLFDSPVHLLILLLVIVLLFGAKRLPDAARGLGRSMRILKSEVRDMKDEDDGGAAKRSAIEQRPVTRDDALPPRTAAEPPYDSRTEG